MCNRSSKTHRNCSLVVNSDQKLPPGNSPIHRTLGLLPNNGLIAQKSFDLRMTNRGHQEAAHTSGLVVKGKKETGESSKMHWTPFCKSKFDLMEEEAPGA